MKYLAIFLALFIFALSAKPCADGENDMPHPKEVSQQHDDHGHASDLCSPFCHCACCGLQIVHHIPQEFYGMTPPAMAASKPVSRYKTRLVSDYSGSIWQPPQLT